MITQCRRKNPLAKIFLAKLRQSLAKLKRNLGKFDWIWAKSKSCIPKNIQSPSDMWLPYVVQVKAITLKS